MRAQTARTSAYDKAAGCATYPADLFPPDCVFAMVVFTNQPHARLTAMRIARCRAVPGVIDVLTADDVPVNSYGLIVPDQPVLVGVGGARPDALDTSVSRWEGDHVAVVLATTREAAAAGAEAVECDWSPLPLIADIDEAMRDEFLVHPEHPAQSNTYVHTRVRRGNAREAWARAAVRIECEYDLPWQEHAYLQPESGLAYIDAQGRVTVIVAGQWAHEDQRQIARALNLSVDAVRVVYPAIGGAFGGREDVSVHILLALAAMRLARRGDRRAVCMEWTRGESIVGHHKRHRGRVRAQWGAARDGSIVMAQAQCVLDSGAYNSTTNKVLGNLALTVTGPYVISNIDVDACAVYTNNVPGGAFRGFGAPQGALIAETQMNRLAEAVGVDPVEMRLRHCYREGSPGPTGHILPDGVSLPEVVERCAEVAGWPNKGITTPPMRTLPTLPATDKAIRRGRGFACGFKNVGFSFGFPEACDVEIILCGTIHDDEPSSVELYHAAADVGQGSHDALVAMTARATGVPSDRVRCFFSDTATCGDSGSASASRMTWMAGNSILGAVAAAEKKWRDGERPARVRHRFEPRRTDPLDPEDGSGDPCITYGYVAQCVQVQVDIETGIVRVDHVWSVTDAGFVIDEVGAHGQVVGAIAQGCGYALLERLESLDGHLLNPRFSGYLIPGIDDVATITSELLELVDPQGPWGARGIGEMPMIPVAAAVVAAVHDATGIWVDAVPLTPDRVMRALQRKPRTAKLSARS